MGAAILTMKGPTKTDASNGSHGISRVIIVSSSPSPDPKRTHRQRAALVSYWLLFVFSPLAGFLVWLGITAASLTLLLPLFFILVLIGEHALRPWMRLWRVP